MLLTNLDELKKDGKVDLYNCGSQRLSHEIRTKLGIVPIKIYKHNKTGKLVNVFVMTKDLSNFLKEWTKNKPIINKEVSNG